MRIHRTLPLLAGLALLVAACASQKGFEGIIDPVHRPNFIEADAPHEEAILQRLDAMPNDAPVDVGSGVTVRAGPTYTAASGRLCRWVYLEGSGSSAQRRLACRRSLEHEPSAPNAGWSFVPWVFPGQESP